MELETQLIVNLQISMTQRQPFFEAAEVPITISFSSLGLSIGGVRVLTNVSGVFKHSRMIAIMGPSGAREAANRVTVNCWYQRQCGAVGVDASTCAYL